MKSETRSEIRDQIIFIICFIAAWYVVYKMRVFSPTAFPSVGDIGESFVTAFTTNDMLSYTGHSLLLIAKGLAIGIGLAFIFSSLAVINKHFHAVYNLIVSICDLLPGVALCRWPSAGSASWSTRSSGRCRGASWEASVPSRGCISKAV